MLSRNRIKRHSHLIKVKSQFAAHSGQIYRLNSNHSAHSTLFTQTDNTNMTKELLLSVLKVFDYGISDFLCERKWKGFALEINSTKVFLKSGEAQKSVVSIEWLSSYSVVVIIMQQSYNHMLIIRMALTKEKEKKTLTPFQCIECAFWILLIDSFFKSK